MSNLNNTELMREIAYNVTLQCEVDDCDNHRVGISRYCSTHLRKKQLFGSPTGFKLRKNKYMKEAPMIEKVLEKQADHPGLQTALMFLDGLLKDAVEKPLYNEQCFKSRLPAHGHLRDLVDVGITAMDILVVCCSVLAYMRRIGYINETREELVLQLGAAVLYCRQYSTAEWKSKKRIGRTPRRRLGEYLVTNLLPFMFTVVLGVEKYKQVAAEARDMMKKPFEFDVRDIMDELRSD